MREGNRKTILSIQFNRSVVSDSLWPHGLQHARPPSPLPTPEFTQTHVLWWCHPTIPSSANPFSSGFQSFPASGFFPKSQFFPWGSQSIGVLDSTSVLLMNAQEWFPLGWTGWISLKSKERSKVFSSTTVQKHQFFGAQLSLESNSHPYMTTGKTIALTRQTFVHLKSRTVSAF